MRSLFLVVALGACGGAPAQPATPSSFGLQGAVDEALRQVPGGHALEIERDAGEGTLQVDVLDGEVVFELTFEASSGQLLDRAPESLTEDEMASLPALSDAVTARAGALQEALRQAIARHGEEALVEVELEVEADRELWVEVELTDGQTARHRLGATP